jgi:D-arabinose 1-dehydrogenase-like Zn-dependent alcohol dehydrogenase
MKCMCVTEHGAPLVPVEVDAPVLQGNEVLVKVTAAGVCHTDLHLWEGGYDLGAGKRLNVSERGISLPMTLGHEIAGTIIEVGPEGDTSSIGRRCVVHPWLGCGECPSCSRGQENLCVAPRTLGVFKPGGYAEYVVVPDAKFCVDIGDLDDAQAALMACSGVTTYSALRKFGDNLMNEPLVIIGAGGLGLMALNILHALDYKGAIVVDIDDVKLEAAKESGALAVINSSDANAVDLIIEATGGGAAAVLDVVGAEATLNLALASVARGAHIVVCGLYGGELVVPIPYIPMKPLHIQGSWVGTLPELRALVDLAQKFDLPAVPVTEYPLDQAYNALSDLAEGRLVGRAILVP